MVGWGMDLMFIRPCPSCGGRGYTTLLSPREQDVLLAYVRIGDQANAAKLIGMSTQTFKNHLISIYRKLGVDSALEACYVLWLRDHFGDTDGKPGPRL